MKLIDADKLKADFIGKRYGVQAIEYVIDQQPTVEIVRCEDCKWWNKSGCAIEIVDDSDKPKDDDYCSFGERE